MKFKAGKNVAVSEIIESLKSADVNHVFGEATEKYGKTIIPVGKVCCSFGYGFGSSNSEDSDAETAADKDGKEDGFGGGGGASFKIKPVGYIEVTPSCTKFVKTPLFSFKSALLGVSLFKMGAMFGLGLAGLLYCKKKHYYNHH